MITLVYFRSANMPQTVEVFKGLAGKSKGMENLSFPIHIPGLLLAFYLLDNWVMKERVDIWLGKFSLPVRWAFYAACLASIWLLGGAVNHPFVYFQF